MIIEKDTVFSKIVSWTSKELDTIDVILSPEDWKKPSKYDAVDTDAIKTFLHQNDDCEYLFYTGLIDFIKKRLPDDFDLEIIDNTSIKLLSFEDLEDIQSDYLVSDSIDGFKLRDYQLSATKKALVAGRGIIEAATGAGKSACAALLLKTLSDKKEIRKSLFIAANSTHLLDQTYNTFIDLGLLDSMSIGKYGGGTKDLSKDLTIATVSSLFSALKKRDKKVIKLLSEIDCIILDECHSLRSKSWVNVTAYTQCNYRYGMTASLHHDPKSYHSSDLFIIGLTGTPVCKITLKYLINKGYLARPVVYPYIVSTPKLQKVPRGPMAWHHVYKKGVIQNNLRNSAVVNFSSSFYDQGYRVLVFTGQKDHGYRLAERLHKRGVENLLFVSGDRSVDLYEDGELKAYKWAISEIKDWVYSRDNCVIISTQVFDQGIDIPAMNAMVLAIGTKRYRRAIQRIGRILRPKEGSNEVYVLDFDDRTHYFLENHSKYRRWIYAMEGFQVIDTSRDLEEMVGFGVNFDNLL